MHLLRGLPNALAMLALAMPAAMSGATKDIKGIDIIVRPYPNGTPTKARSDASGVFRFVAPQPGRYRVTLPGAVRAVCPDGPCGPTTGIRLQVTAPGGIRSTLQTHMRMSTPANGDIELGDFEVTAPGAVVGHLAAVDGTGTKSPIGRAPVNASPGSLTGAGPPAAMSRSKDKIWVARPDGTLSEEPVTAMVAGSFKCECNLGQETVANWPGTGTIVRDHIETCSCVSKDFRDCDDCCAHYRYIFNKLRGHMVGPVKPGVPAGASRPSPRTETPPPAKR